MREGMGQSVRCDEGVLRKAAGQAWAVLMVLLRALLVKDPLQVFWGL